nr:sulfite reductase subunit A [Candidatus Dadabacteria bacterium]NIQ13050.1 sulfite reductase subunit A [Candidatus Dadabacteria bacterium]
MNIGEKYILACEDFQELLDTLRDEDYQVIGPTVKDNAIIYDEISSISELPYGYTDEQDGGKYRLKKRNDSALFGYAVGPHSWKKFLHPPVMSLWKAERTAGGLKIVEEKE